LEKRKLGFILVFLAGVCWGSAGVLGKILMESGLQPEVVAMYRLILGFLVLTLVFLVLNPTILRVKFERIPYLMLGGIIGVAGGISAYFYAVKLISASVAVILLYTYPVFVLIFAKIFVKEKLTIRKIFSVILVIFGCFLVVKGYNLTYLRLTGLGMFIGLTSALAYAVYMIISKVMLKDIDEPTIVIYTLGFGALTLATFNLIFNQVPFFFETQTLFLIFLIAIIPTSLAFTLFIFGLKLVETGKASIYTTSEILSALILAFIILGERLEFPQIFGAIIVFSSIVMIYWK